jgi:hypothetical protein
VLRPLLDYLLLAFGREVRIVVADVPLQSADIDQIWRETGVAALNEHYQAKGCPVSFLDLRREKAVTDHAGFMLGRVPLPGDPLGYVEVNLDKDSYLDPICGSNSIFSVNDYEPGVTTCHHQSGNHRYLVPKTVLTADLFVNVPKLKTHCKAGMTACMKNLIGINGDKAWIPHFRMGAPRHGGDEYSDTNSLVLGLKTRIRKALQGHYRWIFHFAFVLWKNYKTGWEKISGSRLTSGGAWSGNDTLWRSILDLVRIITFSDHNGVLKEKPQRQQLCVVDAVVCGEGEGPLIPKPKQVGAILCSSSPISADWAACHMIGFDWKKLPQLLHARDFGKWFDAQPDDPYSLTVSWSGASTDICPLAEIPIISFQPPSEWIGHVEIDKTLTSTAEFRNGAKRTFCCATTNKPSFKSGE